MLTQEDKINIELIKKRDDWGKTTLPSLRNQHWKKVKVLTGKVNKLLTGILTGNITELNDLIYAAMKVW